MGPLFQVGLCWTLGFLTTNYSFGMAAKGSVSFTHAVKATEPVFLVAIASLFFGRSFSLGKIMSNIISITTHNKSSGVWLSLLPIVGGIAIVAVSDLSFTTTSLLMTMIANCCFVARSLFVKKIFSSGVRNPCCYDLAAFGSPCPFYFCLSLACRQLQCVLLHFMDLCILHFFHRGWR